MTLTGVHVLLSYQCTYECDHCFVWSSPRAGGTMSLEMMTRLLDQAHDLGTITDVYFEGGEPFVFYPLMVEGIRLARVRGFSTGVVTNCYWATAQPDAELWLRPLRELEVGDFSVSSDAFHAGDEEDPRPGFAAAAARAVGLDEAVITIEPPAVCTAPDEKGLPIVGGSVRFRGRAAANLTEALPRRPWSEFDECPDEDFLDPGRVHVDGWGNVHLCQGVLLGNINGCSLAGMLESYDPHGHPIIGPLLAGGPTELVRAHELPHESGYVDACHLCYEARRALRERFPEHLGPPQVYGIEDGGSTMDIRGRWIDLIHRAATGTKTTRTLLTPVGVLVFGAFVSLFVVTAVWVDRLLHLPGLLPDGLRLGVSIPLMAVGIAATAWSGFHFVRVKGTPVPFNPPPEVVSTGPYRYARNPMLTGVFLFLFGLGLALDSFSLVMVFTPLFILANVWELKAIEEPELVKRFGDAYEDYRRRTPMFIPRPR